MMFETENQMLGPLVRGLDAVLRLDSPFAHATEIHDGPRVIDLVVAEVNNPIQGNHFPEHLRTAFSGLTNLQIAFMATVWREKRIRLRRLASLTWTSEKETKDLVSTLANKGVVELTQRGTVKPTEWASWCDRPLYSIELKISAWSEAIGQAADNLRRSDYSLVAFPHGFFERHPERVREARKAGIGVIGVHPDRGPTLLSRGRQSKQRRSVAAGCFRLMALRQMLRDSNRWSFSAVIN